MRWIVCRDASIKPSAVILITYTALRSHPDPDVDRRYRPACRELTGTAQCSGAAQRRVAAARWRDAGHGPTYFAAPSVAPPNVSREADTGQRSGSAPGASSRSDRRRALEP